MSYRLSLKCVLPLVACLLLIPAVEGADTTIGAVKRVKPQVDAIRASEVLHLAVASKLQQEDVLRSGEDARLEAEFLDGTRLTLGENAELKLDRYVYDPANALRNRLIAKVKGAFLFIGGRMKRSSGNIAITTPNALVEVQGKTFWAGPIDDAYGVLAVTGVVSVTTNGGSVTLTDGQGTTVTSVDAPPALPKVWPDAKRRRAFAAVAFE